MVTIDDFIKGYVSPENEIVVPDADGVGLDVDVENDGAVSNNCVTIYATARTRKDIPVRIGDGENKDIYGRAPAWMRYTIELKVTDTDGKVLYADSKQCSGYNECQFEANISVPANGIVLVHSRSIDQYGNASEWTVKTTNLDTNVEKLMISDDLNASYYDLQGRKVTNPTRGIYIKEGRKVVIK